MKKQFLICCAAYLMAASLPANAQVTDTTLKSKYESEAIMLEGNKNQYSKNKEWNKIGIFGDGLEKEFVNVSPESKEELHVYRKHKKRGAILLTAGATVLVTAVFFAPVIVLPVLLSGGATGLTSYYIGAFELNKSRRHLQKAVWLRNRDVIAKL